MAGAEKKLLLTARRGSWAHHVRGSSDPRRDSSGESAWNWGCPSPLSLGLGVRCSQCSQGRDTPMGGH